MNLFDGISQDVQNAPALGPVNPGTYLARIEFLKCATQKPERGGKHYLTVTFDLSEEETAAPVDMFLGFLPSEDDDAKRKARTLRDMQSLQRAFNLPPDVFESENWTPIGGDESKLMNRTAVGAQGMLVLRLVDKKDENKQPTGEKENSVSAMLPMP